MYHHNYDIPWNATSQSLPNPITLNAPSEYITYLKSTYGEGATQSYINIGVTMELTYTQIMSPAYYLNEINAYTSEENACDNVSDEYRLEREFLLWRNVMLLDIANQYYKK